MKSKEIKEMCDEILDSIKDSGLDNTGSMYFMVDGIMRQYRNA